MRVQKELNATSAQDDFARWAKLRRQLDKLQEQFKNFSKSPTSSNHGEVTLWLTFDSFIRLGIEDLLQPHSECHPTGRCERIPILHTMELHDAASILFTKGMGALVWRMDLVVPSCTKRQCLCADMAVRMWCSTGHDV
jgi:hypothetical protein